MRIKETILYEVGDVFVINSEYYLLVKGRGVEDDFKTLELISLKTFKNTREPIPFKDEITSEDIARITPGIWDYAGTFDKLYGEK
jgi:hypothetical protein